MDVPAELRSSIRRFGELGRWERAELGRSLRRLGLSYGEIQRLIPVPKGTLAGWCRGIHLTPLQIAALQERCGPAAGPRDTQWKRRQEIARIRAAAADYATAHIGDPFWVAGTVLYWGEGSKTTRKLELSNADPRALRLFMHWTRMYLDGQARFVAALNVHADNDEPAARLYWMQELGLTASDFTKSYVKPDGTGHRKNHLPWGVCRIRLRRGTDAFLQVMEWIDVLGREMGPPYRYRTG